MVLRATSREPWLRAPSDTCPPCPRIVIDHRPAAARDGAPTRRVSLGTTRPPLAIPSFTSRALAASEPQGERRTSTLRVPQRRQNAGGGG